MEDNNEKQTHGFVLEGDKFYKTRDNKIIDIEKFKNQCKKAGIEDWLSEIKKL